MHFFYSCDVFEIHSSTPRCELFSYNCLYLGFLLSKGVFIWRKNIPAKQGPRLSEISPYKRILLKNRNLVILK